MFFLNSVKSYLLRWLNSIVQSRPTNSKQKSKTYDYRQLIEGRDYIFESIEGGDRAYLTGQGKNVKRSDYLILSDRSHYQVEKIDYYANPPDMWIALLKRVLID
jgi:MioC protein